jgi:hypothetical protein
VNVVPIEEIKLLNDDELKKAINQAGRLASNYKHDKSKKAIYKVVRTNLDHLQSEHKLRKPK